MKRTTVLPTIAIVILFSVLTINYISFTSNQQMGLLLLMPLNSVFFLLFG